ncbi:MAG: ComEA family DNA-binding protein [Chloroflexota bacterium]|nr:ComEA family DNA-binding protein [Chloroflexota bacterium]
MSASQSNRFWTVFTLFLVAIIIAGSVLVWSRYRQHQPVEISIAKVAGETPFKLVSISGAVTRPGIYPLKPGDNIETLIQAAGGTASNADLSSLTLHIPAAGEERLPQKININRAEAWLLEALPGIGESRAKAITDYRRQKGPFRQASDISSVEGIGPSIYEQVKDLITVTD